MRDDMTPMMKQYLEIKGQNRDAILFFRMGDFYEMFFEDAIEATRILHITLTSRGQEKGKKIPMCGVPHHSADSYIARLIKSGKKVAICEQVEEPSPGKKIVKREVVKVITPGTFIAADLLDGAVNKYILSLNPGAEGFGMAYADISTGEFRVGELSGYEGLLSELYKISPSECVLPEELSADGGSLKFSDITLGTMTFIEGWMFEYGLSLKELQEHFRVKSLEGFGCQDMKLGVGAAGALLRYLKSTQRSQLRNINGISVYSPESHMVMDRNTQRHLELLKNQEDLSEKNTLFDVLDRTCTPMGKRKIKKWILNPLLDADAVNRRLDIVQHFYDNNKVRSDVRELLDRMYDVERLSNRISMGTANARDMAALALSLSNVATLKGVVAGDPLPEGLDDTISGMEDLTDIIEMIDECIEEEPPVSVREGGLIKKGYDPEVDELKAIISRGKDWVAELQKKEVERTGINSLKVGYNKVFGYYIEVTKSNLDAVPEDYVRKQTLVNAERFITQDLKAQESRIIGAEDRIKELEYDIFCRLREKVGKHIERLKGVSDRVSDIDVFSALAEASVSNGYTRPVVSAGKGIRIVQGRHPVLEKILRDKEFVPNDVSMSDEENRIFIITGSNMAGKSTFIRQVALIVIMAQMGSFVPAAEAEIGVVDRIFTRVGASDRLYHGMSTFMVEMLETANILNNATSRSLIILDEIGRGTSTFDGVSIAWAVVEYIHGKIKGAKAMFATHYHEITELARIMEGIKNYHLAVQEWGEEIVFLYRVEEGSCDESFGIHVAKLAGMPPDVVSRSRKILENLQKDSFFGNIKARFAAEEKKKEEQLDLFDQVFVEHPVIGDIRALDTDRLTPIKAFEKILEFKKKINGKGKSS